MSHCRASSLHDHLDHCFVVFKDIQHSFLTRRMHFWQNKINIIQIIGHSLRLLAFVNRVRANNGSPRSIMVLSRVSKNWNNQIPVTALQIQSWFAAWTDLYSKSILPYSPLKWMVSRLFFFLSECSTAQRAYPLEYRMSWILKMFHHLWRTKIPLATIPGCISLIPLTFFSGSQECPVSIVKCWGIFFDLPWGKSTRIFVIFPFQFDVIEHWHENYSITDFFKCDVLSLQVCLNFVEMSNAVAPGKIFHSKSIGSPSNPCNSLKVWHIFKVDTLSFHLLIASSGPCCFPKHNTESE